MKIRFEFFVKSGEYEVSRGWSECKHAYVAETRPGIGDLNEPCHTILQPIHILLKLEVLQCRSRGHGDGLVIRKCRSRLELPGGGNWNFITEGGVSLLKRLSLYLVWVGIYILNVEFWANRQKPEGLETCDHILHTSPQYLKEDQGGRLFTKKWFHSAACITRPKVHC